MSESKKLPVGCRFRLWHSWQPWKDLYKGTVTFLWSGDKDSRPAVVQERRCAACNYCERRLEYP